MANDSKKPPTKPGKTITDFFARKPAQSSPRSQPKLSRSTPSPQQLPRLSKSFPALCQDQEVISVSSGSQVGSRSASTAPPLASPGKAKSRTFMDAVEIVSPRQIPSHASRSQRLCSPVESAPRRRHSPGLECSNVSSQKRAKKLHTEKTRLLGKRKKVFESDSDTEAPDSVVYVLKSSLHRKPPMSTTFTASQRLPQLASKENLTVTSSQMSLGSRKKARMSSPAPSGADVEGLIPGSQSDEEEMGCGKHAKHDQQSAQRKVDRWRKEKLIPPSDGLLLTSAWEVNNKQVDMDVLTPFSTHSNSSSWTLDSAAESGAEVNIQATTPPTTASTNQSLPSTPIALDAASKTAQIIADIKAKAYAESLPSPEHISLVDFKEELEESTDEDDGELWKPLNKAKGGRSNADDDDPFSVPSVSTSRTGRYHLSRQTASPSPSGAKASSSKSSRRSAAVPSRRPNILTNGTKKNKGKETASKKTPSAQNPLEMLLREKKQADKRGKGTEALRRAEDAVAGKNAEDNKDVGTADWTDETAARMAVEERVRMGLQSSDTYATGNGTCEVVLDEADRQRLFGEKRGKAIAGILESDREKLGRTTEKVRGVPLWDETRADRESPMKVETSIALLGETEDHPIFALLRSAVSRGDIAQASLLLQTCVLAPIDFTKHKGIIPYLCDLALFPNGTALSTFAFKSLFSIWNQPRPPSVGIPLSCVISTLVRLGAMPAVFNAMAWVVDPPVRKEDVETHQREDILYRLVTLLTLSARFGGLPKEDISDDLMVLLLIAIDPSSSDDLRRDIMLAVDAVCQSIAQGTDVSAEMEAAICTRLLKFVSFLSPINKAFCLSFFAGGGFGRTRRIARWVARSIIIGADTLNAETYTDLPPLLDLLKPLVSTAEPDSGPDCKREMFEPDEMADYVDMGYYVEILAVAISNVEGYVVEERKHPLSRAPSARSLGSPSKQLEKPETPLQLVRSAIENLHSKIADTRAAHLDRSRTKAALKQVSMRVYYQRLAALKTGRSGISSLKHYFAPKK